MRGFPTRPRLVPFPFPWIESGPIQSHPKNEFDPPISSLLPVLGLDCGPGGVRVSIVGLSWVGCVGLCWVVLCWVLLGLIGLSGVYTLISIVPGCVS